MLMISTFIFEGKIKKIQRKINNELKKSIIGFVLMNDLSIIPKVSSCSSITKTMPTFRFLLIIIPISIKVAQNILALYLMINSSGSLKLKG